MKNIFFKKEMLVVLSLALLIGCEAPSGEQDIAMPEGTSVDADATPEQAQQFSENLSIGWNLGNTFDAYNGYSELGAALDLETSWCGAITTKDVIDSIRDAGFTSIRIPVSWHNHVSGDDFEINSSWMTRVNTVVDYAIEDGLYVIINSHHDVDKSYYYPSDECYENSAHYVECIWSQLSETYKDYDEHLIFEPINEPRMVGESNEWWMPADRAKTSEGIRVINELNQVFVDTVRASGGNNASRYLLIPGYCTSADGVLDNEFKLPEDTVANRLLVTVHAYTPYDFALQMDGRGNFTENDKAEIERLMTSLDDKFVSNGIPVVMGEFGALDKNNLEDRIAFTEFYVQTAADHGIPCLWWDNNAFGTSGENFGLIRRNKLEWVFPEIKDSMISVYEEN